MINSFQPLFSKFYGVEHGLHHYAVLVDDQDCDSSFVLHLFCIPFTNVAFWFHKSSTLKYFFKDCTSSHTLYYWRKRLSPLYDFLNCCNLRDGRLIADSSRADFKVTNHFEKVLEDDCVWYASGL